MTKIDVQNLTKAKGTINQEELDREVSLGVWNSKPSRLSEIWKLERETNTVAALGLEGVVQLNAMGSAIWLRLDGEHTIGCIVEELVRVYPHQDRSRIELDVMSFINHLVANRLVILDWCPL